MVDKMQQTTIQLPEDLQEQASIAAKKKGLSLAALIRMLLIEYLEKENR